jgi:hypothetical protein
MIQVFEYEQSPIQFEVIDGQVMASATLMAKAFGKEPNGIFKTKTWKDFEETVAQDLNCKSEDIRTSKMGHPENGGGSWIHQELVLEFSRRLNTRFSLWCNRVVAELMRNGTVTVKPKTAAEQLLDNAKVMVEHEHRLQSLEQTVRSLVESKEAATAEMLSLPLSTEEVPEESERTQVLRLVNNYCEQTGISQHETWSKIYDDLYYKYRISIRAYKKKSGEKSLLDVAVRVNCVGKIKALISSMINDIKH